MTTTIFYYTGTGNSLWTARRLASLLEEAQCVSMKRCTDVKIACGAQRIGLVFPVHIWGVPPPVVEFVRRLNVNTSQYLFAMAVNAGQVAATLIQLQRGEAASSLVRIFHRSAQQLYSLGRSPGSRHSAKKI